MPLAATTDTLQTIFIGSQLVVLATAAIVAWWQLREARRLREQQTRPFVIIHLEEGRRPKIYDLVVKNIGSTMARDVRFTFEPEMKSTMKEASLDRLKMFREGISTLPPGKEIRMMFDIATKRYDSGLPDLHEATVSYRSADGKTPYEEKMDLDFGLFWNRLSVEVHGLHDLHKEIKGISKTLDNWNASGAGGLLTMTPRDVSRRFREFDREEVWWRPQEGRRQRFVGLVRRSAARLRGG